LEREYSVEVDGRLHQVKVIGAAAAAGTGTAAARRPPRRQRSASSGGGGASGPGLPSPLQGTILKVAVKKGAEVEEGALICVIEAMKMENEITAHRAGKVIEISVSEGAAVNAGDPICKIE
jgi:acetyl-CoA/propionyl-CoA carboxylase biotin carboxyl carrier protein